MVQCFFPCRQRAAGWNALPGDGTEEPARRDARVLGQQFKVVTRGIALTQFPGIDRGNRKSQVLGYALQGKVVLEPPLAEGLREVVADGAVKLGVGFHVISLGNTRGFGKSIFK